MRYLLYVSLVVAYLLASITPAKGEDFVYSKSSEFRYAVVPSSGVEAPCPVCPTVDTRYAVMEARTTVSYGTACNGVERSSVAPRASSVAVRRGVRRLLPRNWGGGCAGNGSCSG